MGSGWVLTLPERVVILRWDLWVESEWCYIIHILPVLSTVIRVLYSILYDIMLMLMCCVCGLFITLYSVVHTYINCHVVTVFVPQVLQSSWREREWVSAVEGLGGLTYCTSASLCWYGVKIRICQTCFWRRAVGVMLIVSKINYFSFAWFYTFILSFVLFHKNWKNRISAIIKWYIYIYVINF